jgi:hypothetical protein
MFAHQKLVQRKIAVTASHPAVFARLLPRQPPSQPVDGQNASNSVARRSDDSSCVHQFFARSIMT